MTETVIFVPIDQREVSADSADMEEIERPYADYLRVLRFAVGKIKERCDESHLPSVRQLVLISRSNVMNQLLRLCSVSEPSEAHFLKQHDLLVDAEMFPQLGPEGRDQILRVYADIVAEEPVSIVSGD